MLYDMRMVAWKALDRVAAIYSLCHTGIKRADLDDTVDSPLVENKHMQYCLDFVREHVCQIVSLHDVQCTSLLWS